MKKTNRKAQTIIFICFLGALILLGLLSFHLKRNDLYYDNQAITSTEERYSAVDFVVSKENDTQWIFSIGKLSGVKNLLLFTIDTKCQITLNASCSVSNGILKLVFVDLNNGEVISVLCDNNDSTSLNNFEIKPGDYAIRTIGRNATADGYFTLNITQ